MTTKEFLSHLESVRPARDGWQARCPAHEDHDPSLSISENGGKILICCHVGCKSQDILSALGLKMTDLFQDAAQSKRRIAAVYAYLDEKGSVLFEVVRYEPKDFRQRRPDSRGGWTWNLDGVSRVPYRLPEVITARSVLVCEGEKDCETARTLGLVATCNPHGAGKWRPEYSAFLKGKRVVVIADADAPGVAHARDVARSLVGVAECVRLIEALPQAKDLTAWVEKGSAKEQLLDLIRETPELTPADVAKWGASKPMSGFTLTRLGDLMREPEEQVSWLLEGVLPAGGLGLLAAKPKTGKSTLARCLALAVARGESFLNRPTLQGAVIYLALEEKRSEVRGHFRAMGASGEEEILIHAAHAPADAVPAITAEMKAQKPVLLIIDPLLRFTRVKDGNDYAQVTAALEPILILARESGAHVLLVHHLGKGERAEPTDGILGSTALFAAVDTALVMRRTEKYRTLQSRQRYGEDLTETVLTFDPERRNLSLGAERSDADALAVSEEILKFLESATDGKTEPEITEAVEGKTRVVRRALRQLVEQGNVSREGEGKRGSPYRYGFLFSCSQYIAGTREQETQKPLESRENTAGNLVPALEQNSFLVPSDCESSRPPLLPPHSPPENPEAEDAEVV
jgi:5S rRNA maturation endonuclease (ribonuclease M5)